MERESAETRDRYGRHAFGQSLLLARRLVEAGMPVVQAPIDRGKNRYSIAYAFRPGDNGVRFSYELPYAGNSASVKLPTVYPAARLVFIEPDLYRESPPAAS